MAKLTPEQKRQLAELKALEAAIEEGDDENEHYIIVKGKHAAKLKEFFRSQSDTDDEDETDPDSDSEEDPDFDPDEEETTPKKPAPKKAIRKKAAEKDPIVDQKPPPRHRFFQ